MDTPFCLIIQPPDAEYKWDCLFRRLAVPNEIQRQTKSKSAFSASLSNVMRVHVAVGELFLERQKVDTAKTSVLFCPGGPRVAQYVGPY